MKVNGSGVFCHYGCDDIIDNVNSGSTSKSR